MPPTPITTRNAVTRVQPAELHARLGQCGLIIWLTGLSGAGKSTLAFGLERQLFDAGRHVFVLDGDLLRTGLCSDLGFSPEARTENIRRIGEVARLFAHAGTIVIAACISPLRADRDRIRAACAPGAFIEVFVNASLATCEQRDPKGLYVLARGGKLKEFTGISSPYEPPLQAELNLETDKASVEECLAQLMRLVNERLQPKT